MPPAAIVHRLLGRFARFLDLHSGNKPLLSSEIRHSTRQGEESFQGFLFLVILVRVFL